MNTARTHIQGQLLQTAQVPLARYPTPLEGLPQLSKQVGASLWVKRDDQIGPGLGGNKTRKLEFLLGPALASGLRKVVTYGGLQSNHARLTAAAALRLGLEPHLFYFDPRPTEFSGNMLLNSIAGAKMHFFPYFSGGDGSMTLETTNRLVKLLAMLRLGRHHFIPVGGHSVLGCLGYVQAALEIEPQCQTLGLKNALLITAAGTGGTLAGLWAGLELIDSSVQVLGLDIGSLWRDFPKSIARMAQDISRRLGFADQIERFSADRCPLIEHRFTGAGYAQSWTAAERAIRRIAEREGLLLDPVYTTKAFAGMLELIAQQEVDRERPIIFLHTGGQPALMR